MSTVDYNKMKYHVFYNKSSETENSTSKMNEDESFGIGGDSAEEVWDLFIKLRKEVKKPK